MSRFDVFSEVGTPVFNVGRTLQGYTTGGVRRCQLEGCGGVRLGVRWPDGKLTWPCTKGMDYDVKEGKPEWEIK